MINWQLINPSSIVVIGGSNNTSKPSGNILQNIIDGGYKGKLYVVNPHETEVQGIMSYHNVEELPNSDLAIISIPAHLIIDSVRILVRKKQTKAFIIISAGFGEESAAGKKMEQDIVALINSVDGVLIGPNCIGLLTPFHHSIFTEPIPKLDPKGCDFISGSGATACFIMDAGLLKGLTFASVFSIGNSAQTGVEEILAYMDETFDPELSSKVKILYIENIAKPAKLIKHASSLIRKGCRIAAIKTGSSAAGSRAASSHTGAMATEDSVVDALFTKAGIVRCYGREDMVSVASVLLYPELKGRNIAIITHAGGPAVMLTDTLSNCGMNVPQLSGKYADELLTRLHKGSSVSNPIDFLATGTAGQLGEIMECVVNNFDNIDGIVVIFGSPGLFPVTDVYNVLDEKIKKFKKPVFPVLSSINVARLEIEEFTSKGNINFPDEVILGNAISKVYFTPPPQPEIFQKPEIDKLRIREIIDNSEDGYITPDKIQALLDAAGIPRTQEAVVTTVETAVMEAVQLGFPIAMKVVGLVHKTDVGGVVLNVKDAAMVEKEFKRMVNVPGANSILIQPMVSGIELFAGAKKEGNFGHLVLCGMGGIFIEILKDVSAGLVPIGKDEAMMMISRLKSYKVFKGMRGQEGVDPEKFAEVIIRLSALLEVAPEIAEMDINPLLGKKDKIIAVDARIRISKMNK